MKIPADNDSVMKIMRIRNTSGVEKSSATKKSSSDSSSTPSVEISMAAMELQGIREDAKNVPDVRMEKVNQLKDKIEKGEYSIDVDKLAEILSKYLK
ncbi:MAG: flagellar biosynthesis anti-sigma factor FlgM [Firmicutes bacterium]|nr:flagellar biosynthesis anti-sigma factor FlgM [Bacillota bacterium]